jgi:tRNA(fMet)-specific endonuclease VapC
MPRPGGYLLDTNVVVALVRNDELGKSIERTYQLTSGAHAFYVPIVVLGETHALAMKWGWGATRRTTLARILTAFTALDISYTDVVLNYAVTDAESEVRSGITMGKNDLWIAALARTYDMTILTTDTDFDHLHTAGILDRILVDPASK